MFFTIYDEGNLVQKARYHISLVKSYEINLDELVMWIDFFDSPFLILKFETKEDALAYLTYLDEMMGVKKFKK